MQIFSFSSKCLGRSDGIGAIHILKTQIFRIYYFSLFLHGIGTIERNRENLKFFGMKQESNVRLVFQGFDIQIAGQFSKTNWSYILLVIHTWYDLINLEYKRWTTCNPKILTQPTRKKFPKNCKYFLTFAAFQFGGSWFILGTSWYAVSKERMQQIWEEFRNRMNKYGIKKVESQLYYKFHWRSRLEEMSHIVSRFMCETKRMTRLEGNKYEWRVVKGKKLPNRGRYISNVDTECSSILIACIFSQNNAVIFFSPVSFWKMPIVFLINIKCTYISYP